MLVGQAVGYALRYIPAINMLTMTMISTYDHRTLRTELPVRSAVLKQGTGGLVVRWVTTSESPLLYVFCILFAWISWCMGLGLRKVTALMGTPILRLYRHVTRTAPPPFWIAESEAPL